MVLPVQHPEIISDRPIYEGTQERPWAAGDRLRGRRGVFDLQARAGRGRTGQVFRALWEGTGRLVAVKIRWDDLGEKERARLAKQDISWPAPLTDDARPLFAAEGITLIKLRDAEEACGDGLRMVPELFEMWPPPASDPRTVPDTHYIVEEFIESEQVNDLIGRLPEEEALLIGKRFCRLLHLLHTQLKRTYASVVGSDESGRPVFVSDMKLQNLWWDRQTQTLKVTDWNVIGPEGDLSGEQADLFRFSRYLYQMLVGSGLQEQDGLIRTRPDAAPGWHKLSLGSQQVLQKALHANKAQRYQTAQELENALDDQWKLWHEVSGVVLIGEAEKQIEALVKAPAIPPDMNEQERLRRSRERRELLEKARNRLQIAATRPGTDEPRRVRLLAQLDVLLKQEKNLVEAGRDLYIGQSYDTARSLMQETQEANPWNLEVRRWLVVMDKPFPDRASRERTSQALSWLAQGRYKEAEDELVRLKLGALALEAGLRRVLEEANKATGAQPPDYAAAAKWYAGLAKEIDKLRQIPYWELLKEDVGDPGALAQEMRQLAATVGIAQRKQEDGRAAWLRGDLATALACYRDGLNARPGDEALITACNQAGRDALQAGKPRAACLFLELALDYDEEGETARSLWRIVAVRSRFKPPSKAVLPNKR